MRVSPLGGSLLSFLLGKRVANGISLIINCVLGQVKRLVSINVKKQVKITYLVVLLLITLKRCPFRGFILPGKTKQTKRLLVPE